MDLSPEIVARARQDYLDGRRIREICRDCGITLHTLYGLIDGGPAAAGLPPLPRRTDARPPPAQKLTGNREAVVQRFWRTAERQVRDIENRLIAAGQPPDERERDARLMAVLVKTLCELSALDDAKSAKVAGRKGKGRAHSRKAGPGIENESDGPQDSARDIEEFRRELARRIAALAGDETPAADSADAGA